MRSKIVKFLFKLSWLMLIASACCLDSKSKIPMVCMIVSEVYILICIKANIKEDNGDE